MKYYIGSDSTYNRPCEKLYSHCHTTPEVDLGERVRTSLEKEETSVIEEFVLDNDEQM